MSFAPFCFPLNFAGLETQDHIQQRCCYLFYIAARFYQQPSRSMISDCPSDGTNKSQREKHKAQQCRRMTGWAFSIQHSNQGAIPSAPIWTENICFGFKKKWKMCALMEESNYIRKGSTLSFIAVDHSASSCETD